MRLSPATKFVSYGLDDGSQAERKGKREKEERRTSLRRRIKHELLSSSKLPSLPLPQRPLDVRVGRNLLEQPALLRLEPPTAAALAFPTKSHGGRGEGCDLLGGFGPGRAVLHSKGVVGRRDGIVNTWEEKVQSMTRSIRARERKGRAGNGRRKVKTYRRPPSAHLRPVLPSEPPQPGRPAGRSFHFPARSAAYERTREPAGQGMAAEAEERRGRRRGRREER